MIGEVPRSAAAAAAERARPTCLEAQYRTPEAEADAETWPGWRCTSCHVVNPPGLRRCALCAAAASRATAPPGTLPRPRLATAEAAAAASSVAAAEAAAATDDECTWLVEARRRHAQATEAMAEAAAEAAASVVPVPSAAAAAAAAAAVRASRAEQAEEDGVDGWASVRQRGETQVRLHNDDVHTFDNVTDALLAVGITRPRAFALTAQVDKGVGARAQRLARQEPRGDALAPPPA